MNLYEFLKLLRNVKGHNGQYSAICPAHDDHINSLSISEGKNDQILLKCHTGCTPDEIVSKLGLNLSDLFPNEKKKKVAEYLYLDEKGETIYKKIRYRPKQFSLAHLEGKKWVYNMKGIEATLYNLPEVIQGISKGKPVYVVEGEKDADTLKEQKRIATCSTHGAGEGKWLSQYNRYLNNGLILILPDNDDIGKAFAREIATKLYNVAKNIKILDLTQIWPGMPEHGDITDLIDYFGKSVLSRMDELAEETPEYIPEKQLSLRRYDCDNEFADLFENSEYTVIDGSMCEVIFRKGDGRVQYRPLCNFVAYCSNEKTIDNGNESFKIFELTGRHSSGSPLPTIEVRADEFAGMSWITRLWGIQCNISTGNSMKDKVRNCMQSVLKKTKKETIYTHTGWKKHNGQWVYLSAGGAIGADNIQVKLDGKLQNYRLPRGEIPFDIDIDIGETILRILEMAPHRISMPLLVFTFLSPINEFLKQAGYEPKFVYYLSGKTGTGKSTLAALFLSFFGDFCNTNLPFSFLDTANAIMDQAFLCKDNLLVIDDYKPSTRRDVNYMDSTAQIILRAYGDRTGRNRLNSDSALMAQKSPRGNAIMTGEQPPNVGESGIARMIVSELQNGDINFEVLSKTQYDARSEKYAYIMRAFLEWLKFNYIDCDISSFIGKLRNDFEENRAYFIHKLESVHPRIPEALSHLAQGFQFLMEFMLNIDALNIEQYHSVRDELNEILIQMGKEHSNLSREDKPSYIFITTLSELIKIGAVFVQRIDGVKKSTNRPSIGYYDAKYYYLSAESAYNSVCHFCIEQGGHFPLGLKTLLKHLELDKIILMIDGEHTPRKLINGKEEGFYIFHGILLMVIKVKR